MLRYNRVTVDGRQIHYATEGAGIPLLLVHGPPFDHRAWAPTIPFLAGHFRVVAPDLPGCGMSDEPRGGGAPDELIRTMAGLLTALRMVPCLVAGASFGGDIALGLAARYPERVRSLVAVAAPGLQHWPGTLQASLARAASRLPGMLALGLRLAPRAQARWFVRGVFHDRGQASDAIVEQVAATLQAPAGRRTVILALRQANEWRLVMRQLGGIRAPTLLIWGERDTLYDLSAAERLRHAIPGARLTTIAGAGHMPSIERPAELAGLMRQFFGAVAPTAREGRQIEGRR